jgi:hypothetical protein
MKIKSEDERELARFDDVLKRLLEVSYSRRKAKPDREVRTKAKRKKGKLAKA